MLELQLVKVNGARVAGAYSGRLPDRMLWVHPEVLEHLELVAPRVVLSDLFRSPESSLQAMQVKQGVQPPAFSHHSFGGAFDLDIPASLARGGFQDRTALDRWLTERGWPMFWIRPGAEAPRPRSRPWPLSYNRGLETWHHSHLPRTGFPGGTRSTEVAAEAWIQSKYWLGLRPDEAECQELLKQLGFYGGAIDGKIGPLSRQAAAAFQRAWLVARYARAKGAPHYQEGQLDLVTRRVLAYVAAARRR